VFAVHYTHTSLSFDIVEVLGGDEGYLAHPAEAAPMSGPSAVAVILQTAAFEGGGRTYALNLCTTFRSKEYSVYETRHFQPSFESCYSFERISSLLVQKRGAGQGVFTIDLLEVLRKRDWSHPVGNPLCRLSCYLDDTTLTQPGTQQPRSATVDG
jgi:hypothetical protein